MAGRNTVDVTCSLAVSKSGAWGLIGAVQTPDESDVLQKSRNSKGDNRDNLTEEVLAMRATQAPSHGPDHQNGPRLGERAALDAPEVWPEALLEKSERLLTVVTQLSNCITALNVDDREFASGMPTGGIPQGDVRTNEVDRMPHAPHVAWS